MTQQIDAVQSAELELTREREALKAVEAKRDDFARRHAQAVSDAAGMTGRVAAGEDGVTTELAVHAHGAVGVLADALAVLNSEISVQVERVRLAELALLGARINAGAGGLLTVEQIAAKIAQAREQVDEILFVLADDFQAHNDLLESLYAAVSAATPWGSGHTVPGVSLPSGDPFNHSIRSAHGTYSRVAVSARTEEPANGSYHRWNADRNAEAIAAQRAEEQRLQEDAQRLGAERLEARRAEARRAEDGQRPNPGKPVRLDGAPGSSAGQ